MKVLAASDIHGDRSLAEKLAQRAHDENVDLVLLCGDLSYFDREPKGIISPFLKHKKKVLIIPGNHDSHATTDILSKIYPVKNVHGYAVKYSDIGFFACGKANMGLEAMSEEELELTLMNAQQHIKYLDKQVMLTHVHPSGTMMEKMTKFFPGSTGVRNVIEKLQPTLALCGHVHEAEGLEEQIGATKLVNVGRKGHVFEL